MIDAASPLTQPCGPQNGQDTGTVVMTREPQYAPCFREPPVTLGPMAGSTWRWNPRRLGFVLARYKFVAQMLAGAQAVAEIGCADGFASCVVAKAVGRLDVYDFDLAWVREAEKFHLGRAFQCDIVNEGLPSPVRPQLESNGRAGYDAVFMLDVLEHIQPVAERRAIAHIVAGLDPQHGIFIAGVPSLESQAYAAEISKAGHVNCRSGERLRTDMRKYFRNVFLFGMNDEMVHVGFAPMCHYLFAVCTGPRTE